jgi:polar amino acid transport system substrate-binding protein
VEADLTYLVPAGSAFRTVAEVDQPGVRIAVPRGDITDLRLSRVLQHATLVRTDTSDAARELLHTGQAQALAAPRYALLRHAAYLPGVVVLADRFDVIRTAMVVPQGHAGRLSYLSDFLAEAKVSGLLQQTIERAGLRGVQVVAPPGNPRAR